jgi:hypothetical protein
VFFFAAVAGIAARTTHNINKITVNILLLISIHSLIFVNKSEKRHADGAGRRVFLKSDHPPSFQQAT